MNSVNDVPSFTKGADQTIDEDDGAQTVNTWATAISKGPANESAQALTFSISNDNNALFSAQPTVDLAGNLTYTPVADANGTATVTLSLSDNGGTANGGVDTSADQSFNITVTAVDDDPLGGNSSVTFDEDTTYTFQAADFPFSDVDSHTFAGIMLLSVETAGDMEYSGTDVTASPTDYADVTQLTFTPDPDDNGLPYATFTFRVKDSSGAYSAATHTMTVNVSPVQDVPTSQDYTFTMLEDGTHTFAQFEFDYNDVDGDAFSKIKVTQLQTAGQLKLSGTPVTLNQEITAANITNLTFEPASDDNGDDYANFQFMVHDGIDFSSSDYTMTINVTPTNDRPTAANMTVTTKEDTPRAFATDEFGYIDIDADNMITIMITQLSTAGTLQLDGTNITLNQVVPAVYLGNMIFTPADDVNGNAYANFRFKVSDGMEYSSTDYALTINVTSVNDAPEFTIGAAVELPESSSNPVTVADWLSGISPGPDDEVGQQLTIEVTTDLEELFTIQPAVDLNTGDLTFTPRSSVSGLAYLYVTITDNGGTANGGQDSTTLISSVVSHCIHFNHLPELDTNNAITLFEDAVETIDATSLHVSDDDDAPSTLTFTVTSPPAHGTLKKAGVEIGLSDTFTQSDIDSNNITYQNIGGDGLLYSDSFNFTVADSICGRVGTRTFTFSLLPVNDTPAITIPPTQSANEDEDTTITGITVSDVDVGTAALEATISVSNGTLSLVNTAGITIIAGDGTDDQTIIFTGTITDIDDTLSELIYHSDSNFNGTDTLTIAVNDQNNTGSGGAKTGTQNLSIVVAAINDTPEVTNVVIDADFVSQGDDMPITISVSDIDSTDLHADFYLDDNNNGIFELGTDSAIETDVAATPGSITFDLPSDTLPYGLNRVFVLVSDDDGQIAEPQQVIVPVTYTRTLDKQHPVEFTDSSGNTILTKLSGIGSADVHFYAEDNSDAVAITMTGTTTKSNLKITNSNRNSTTNIGNITVSNGSLKAITAKNVNLIGDINIDGSLSKLVFGDVTGPTEIIIGTPTSSRSSLSLQFATVEDLSITSLTPLKSIKAINWCDTDSATDTITAPWLAKLTISGNRRTATTGTFEPDLDLTGPNSRLTLGKTKITGPLTGGIWQIVGNVGNIKANSITDNWQLSATGSVSNITSMDELDADITAFWLKTIKATAQLTGSITATGSPDTGIGINKLQAGSIGDAYVDAAAGIRAITTAQWQTGSLTAGWVNTLKITGYGTASLAADVDVSGNQQESTTYLPGDFGADINLTDSSVDTILGTLNIAGGLQESTIRLAGNANTIKLGSMQDSQLHVGTKDSISGAPGSSDDFQSQSSIGSLQIGDGNEPSSLSNSTIAAWSIDTVTLKLIETGTFHTIITADSIDSYSRQTNTTTTRLTDLTDPGTRDTQDNYLLIIL